jgi:hypothetical protein
MLHRIVWEFERVCETIEWIGPQDAKELVYEALAKIRRALEIPVAEVLLLGEGESYQLESGTSPNPERYPVMRYFAASLANVAPDAKVLESGLQGVRIRTDGSGGEYVRGCTSDVIRCGLTT